jgi:hypothetical protein
LRSPIAIAAKFLGSGPIVITSAFQTKLATVMVFAAKTARASAQIFLSESIANHAVLHMANFARQIAVGMLRARVTVAAMAQGVASALLDTVDQTARNFRVRLISSELHVKKNASTTVPAAATEGVQPMEFVRASVCFSQQLAICVA